MYQYRENTDTVEDTIVTIHDSDFNIIRANNVAIKALKLPALNGATIKCYKYFHGKDFPPKQCPACKCVLTKNQDVIEYFEPYLNRCIEVCLVPRFDRHSNYIGLLHVVKNINNKCTKCQGKGSLPGKALWKKRSINVSTHKINILFNI